MHCFKRDPVLYVEVVRPQRFCKLYVTVLYVYLSMQKFARVSASDPTPVDSYTISTAAAREPINVCYHHGIYI